MALVSPGVQVTVTDESFFIPASAPTVPLIFVATGAEKTQQDGVTPAAGTFEANVIRTVTSLNQSIELYGEPSFLEDSSGVALHGDARNEYGLFALNQFLGIGNRAYVVRADVNLDDDLDNIRTIWDSKFVDASTLLTTLVTEFITEFNETNGLVSTDPTYKTSVTEAEFLSLAALATDDVWAFSSFENSEDNYFDDHTIPAAATSGSQTAGFGGRIDQGQQLVNFQSFINAASQIVDVGNAATAGSPSAATGLGTGGSPALDSFGFRVVVDGGATQEITITGAAGITYADLIVAINAALTDAVVDVVDGNLRFTSLTTGATSAINVEDEIIGSPTIPGLLASLTDFVAVNTATVGGGNSTGLVNDATSYSLVVVVDDGTGSPLTGQTLAVQGQNAQTYTELVTALNAQLTGATVAITTDGDILVWSDTVDAATSSIGITDVDLVSSLSSVIGSGSPLSVVLGPPVVDASTVSGSNPTGLANDTTNYTASFTVDGTPRSVQLTGSAAQTYTTLISGINTDLGTVAVAAIVSGNIVVTSASTGTASTVSITDTDLFSSLNWFVALQTAVAGTGVDSSLPVYANGYDQAATGTYDGLEGIAALWFANSLGTVPGEWTSSEAADTILAASDDYKFTVEFRSETSLGANDAARRAEIVTALQSSVNSNQA